MKTLNISPVVFCTFLTSQIFVGSANAQTYQPPEGVDFVCWDDSIESGFVISSIVTDSKLESTCSSGRVLKVQEVTVQNSINICQGSPIPAGWVVTALYPNQPTCAGFYVYTITNTEGLAQVLACSGSTIPEGWVITSTTPNQPQCDFYYSMLLVNTSPPPPPPPPPPPEVPLPPNMQPIQEAGTTHTVSWISAGDLPGPYPERYALEQSINGSNWREIYKGTRTNLTFENVAQGTYSYRVLRITGAALSGYSSVVTVVVAQ